MYANILAVNCAFNIPRPRSFDISDTVSCIGRRLAFRTEAKIIPFSWSSNCYNSTYRTHDLSREMCKTYVRVHPVSWVLILTRFFPCFFCCCCNPHDLRRIFIYFKSSWRLNFLWPRRLREYYILYYSARWWRTYALYEWNTINSQKMVQRLGNVGDSEFWVNIELFELWNIRNDRCLAKNLIVTSLKMTYVNSISRVIIL